MMVRVLMDCEVGRIQNRGDMITIRSMNRMSERIPVEGRTPHRRVEDDELRGCGQGA